MVLLVLLLVLRARAYMHALKLIEKELIEKMGEQTQEGYKELRARSKDLIKKLQSYGKDLNRLTKPTHKWKYKAKKVPVWRRWCDLDTRTWEHKIIGHKSVKSRFCTKCGEE